YSPLPPDTIRLLYLRPDSKDESISYSLVHPIHDLPEFKALSYTWGKPGKSIPVACDGLSLSIQPNAWYALAQLRSSEIVRLLWVDAVCINQKDVQEKSTQLQLMGCIYPEAARVPFWLENG
ncbi:HET-domain-containing protein, partial [Cryphonectria parasitica EP155]